MQVALIHIERSLLAMQVALIHTETSLLAMQVALFHTERSLLAMQVALIYTERSLPAMQVVLIHTERSLLAMQVALIHTDRTLPAMQVALIHTERSLLAMQVALIFSMRLQSEPIFGSPERIASDYEARIARLGRWTYGDAPRFALRGSRTGAHSAPFACHPFSHRRSSRRGRAERVLYRKKRPLSLPPN